MALWNGWTKHCGWAIKHRRRRDGMNFSQNYWWHIRQVPMILQNSLICLKEKKNLIRYKSILNMLGNFTSLPGECLCTGKRTHQGSSETVMWLPGIWSQIWSGRLGSLPAVPRDRSPNLHRPWRRPFVVIKVLSDVTYQFQSEKSKPGCRKQTFVVHFKYLKPCQIPILETQQEGEPNEINREQA